MYLRYDMMETAGREARAREERDARQREEARARAERDRLATLAREREDQAERDRIDLELRKVAAERAEAKARNRAAQAWIPLKLWSTEVTVHTYIHHYRR
jgi:hypothetical protein